MLKNVMGDNVMGDNVMGDLKRTKLISIEESIKTYEHGIFEYWFDHDVYKPVDKYNFLRLACEYKNYKVASELYDCIDEQQETEFIIDDMDLILEEDTTTILMYFAEYNWFELIEKLKGKMSNDYINTREYQEGRTALFLAVESKNLLSVKALIDIGANPNLGTVYNERRFNELREEITNNIPLYYEDLPYYEQDSYYTYLEDYYDNEIQSENYNVRNYVVEISNLRDEFFDVYIEEHIVSNIIPSMVACNYKNLQLLEVLWTDSALEINDSNGYKMLEYAIASKSPDIIKFVFKKSAPYTDVESTEDCSICHGVRSNVKTVCNHLYCEECLLQWLSIKQNCPMCRKQFVQFI
jgi:ankyrin repeat protein